MTMFEFADKHIVFCTVGIGCAGVVLTILAVFALIALEGYLTNRLEVKRQIETRRAKS